MDERFGSLQLTVMNMTAKKPYRMEDVSYYYRVMQYLDNCEAAKLALDGRGASLNLGLKEVADLLGDR
jgi:hypothetical protein